MLLQYSINSVLPCLLLIVIKHSTRDAQLDESLTSVVDINVSLSFSIMHNVNKIFHVAFFSNLSVIPTFSHMVAADMTYHRCPQGVLSLSHTSLH